MNDVEVTPHQAAILAAHATLVQGGYSTPEIEKARAEKDLAQGGKIDWDKMQAEVMDAIANDSEEATAAELEGLVTMPEDLVPYRYEKLELDDQIEALQARKKEIQDVFGARLEAVGAVGFLLHGKVHARITKGTRTSVDSKELKSKMPHIWKQFLKTTEYKSIIVN